MIRKCSLILTCNLVRLLWIDFLDLFHLDNFSYERTSQLNVTPPFNETYLTSSHDYIDVLYTFYFIIIEEIN